jgi:hypothetical protein
MNMDEVTRRNALKAAAVGVALASTGSVAAQPEKKPPEKHDVKPLAAAIKDLSDGLMKLAEGKDFEELLRIVHKPGWTTPAEFMLVSGLLQSMNAQVKTLAGLKQVLLAGSRAVAAG